ncbi:MAG: MBL fold metallo-hydrolase, partial [Myxococcota bacterium]|nr:MBL fold metallo-hydrolase [Myxococcota bacterium]
MKIQFLGSGGAFSDFRKNYHNNALIHAPEGYILLDCGMTAGQSLKELGVHPTELLGILITHIHGDHSCPEPLVWERYYSSPKGFPAFMTTPLYGMDDVIIPLQRSLEPFIGIFTAQNGEVQNNGHEELLELHIGKTHSLGGLEFTFFPVPHIENEKYRKPAYGIRIVYGEKVIYWSGDSQFEPSWINKAAADPAVEAIFHECAFYPKFPGTAHCHWSELLSLPEQTK